MPSMLRRVLAASLFLFLVPAPSLILAQNKCAASKLKAACKSSTCQAALQAKEAQTGDTVDPEKVAKCEASFSKSFTKSEEKGGCVTTGDTATIEGKVDAFVLDLDTDLNVTTGTNPNKCEGEKIEAAAKKLSCKCALEAKQAEKGGTIDLTKFAKCEATFSKSFAKSEEKGSCNTTGDTAVIEAKVDAFLADLDASLPADPTACIPSNGGVEICDGVDNDCDGTIDDGNPGGNVSCGVDTGECSVGTTTCTGGAIDCVGDVGPVTESCNNLDDDCNGVVDNGFNKLTDPRYCANCAGCTLPHAVAGCSAGNCTVAGCLAGFVNLNASVSDGCEYACTSSGHEVCDGLDNDCDGLVDQADPSLLVPGNFCKTAGECAGTTPTCAGMDGWVCVYTDPDVEQVDGDVVPEETRCDGKDNDCDGSADEIYPLKNSACAEDGAFGTTRRLGVCRGTGSLVCNATQTGLRCNVTVAGTSATNETCNNRDDDCDGHVDEPYDSGGFTGVRDVTVGPLTINSQSVVMYRYEASRPDATAAVPGVIETRACSVGLRLPWAGGDFNEALSACQRAGMRLCQVTRDGSGVVTSDEWGRFCEGAANRTYPYGNTFNPNACNGAEYDPVMGGVNEDVAIPTGTLATCEAQELSRDQSGNLKEWVSDPRTVGGQTVHTLRGGSYDNFEQGSTCDFDLTVVPTTYTFANTGFRCCARSCTAGQIDCSGTCVNPATSNSNCGACGQTCGGGTACSNGYCCPTGTRACGDVCIANAMPCP
jgi:putative metal-binding protein